MNQTRRVAFASLLSVITLSLFALQWVIPGLYLLFPLLMPLIMGYAYYQLKGWGYLFYAISIAVLSLIVLATPFDYLILWTVPYLIFGWGLGGLISLKWGWLDMLIVLPFLHGFLTWGTWILIQQWFNIHLFDWFSLLGFQATDIWLIFYAVGLLVTTLILWILLEEHRRLNIPFRFQSLTFVWYRRGLIVLDFTLVIFTFFFPLGSSFLIGLALWTHLYFSLVHFKISMFHLTFALGYSLAIIFLFGALNTFLTFSQARSLIPLFFLPRILLRRKNLH